ncbi:hypothetical protein R3P38DRAFT_2770623 [Favolaschia claudopus]|uniref:F-box domain-containing protein n=1 Tax=Favolaschia claudopus TaxID=2862362 RepID=A0AAW0CJC3_9AGAR
MSLPAIDSPISRMPVEITENILLEVLTSTTSEWSELDTKRDLIHICSRWRGIIFGRRMFWTTIFLHFNIPSLYLLFLIERALSTQRLLDVTIDSGMADLGLEWSGETEGTHEWVSTVLSALAEGADMVRNLTIIAHGQHTLALILRVIRVDLATSLEKADLQLYYEPFFRRPEALMDIPSPSLRSLALYKAYPKWEHVEAPHLSRITELRVGGLKTALSWVRLRPTLEAAPQLRTLALIELRCFVMYGVDPTLEMPNLEKLELFFQDSDELDIFRQLIMPQLVTVEITGVKSAGWPCIHTQCNYLLTRAEDLTLTMGYRYGPTKAMMKTLPCVKILDLRGFPVAFLEWSIGPASEASRTRYPNLRTLITAPGMNESLMQSILACGNAEEISVFEVLGNSHLPYNFRRWNANGDTVTNVRIVVESETDLRSL